MRVEILGHNRETPPGTTVDFLKSKNINYNLRYLEENQTLPTVSEFDFLIVLGGGMNVDEESKFPWLKSEKKLIEKAISSNKTVLGLCLGGQLIAETLGAQVSKHDHWEVGFHYVHLNPTVNSLIPKNKIMSVFQWHGYSFDTPRSAIRFAQNDICENQGFIYNDKVLGLQFHPEASAEWIKICAETEPHEYPNGIYVQNKEQILSQLHAQSRLQSWYFELLENLINRTLN